MKLMCPEKRLTSLFFPALLIALLFTVNLHAQARKSASTSKPVAKKSVAQAKDVRKDKKAASRKDTKKEQLAKKKGKVDPKKEKAVANSRDKRRDAKKADPRKEKLTASELRREKERALRDKKNPKGRAETRRVLAERRREAEKRRQAALAEQRRREQAAREARERRLAFERGLRTTTVENIARDDASGEDVNVRRAAVNALGGHAGTVVVMEAKTGKIVTIVNQDWAIRDSFKPCSTIKLVTGVGGINENIINGDGHITNSSTQMDLDYRAGEIEQRLFPARRYQYGIGEDDPVCKKSRARRKDWDQCRRRNSGKIAVR